MQHQGCTLSHCANNLKILIHGVEIPSGDVIHDLYHCTLLEIHVGEGSDKFLILCLRVGLWKKW